MLMFYLYILTFLILKKDKYQINRLSDAENNTCKENSLERKDIEFNYENKFQRMNFPKKDIVVHKFLCKIVESSPYASYI